MYFFKYLLRSRIHLKKLVLNKYKRYNFLLVEINSCPKCISNNLDLQIVLVDYLLKTKNEFKDLKKQKIQDILIRTTKHAFSLIWLMVF